MPDYEKLDAAIRTRIPQHLDELRTLCAQPSIAAQGVGLEPCAKLVASMLQERGFDVEIHPTLGSPVVVAERNGRSEKTLLFYNHYDVQPPEPLDLWESPPFEPELREGKFYARGASDDKGHIACRLAALDAILETEGELPCAVKFVIEGEEEIGSIHLPDFVRQNAEKLSADACIWEFGGVNHDGRPTLTAGLRGICYVELRVQTASQDAHSGLGGSIFPNAAWRLVWALSTLKGPDERIRLPGFYDRVQPPTPRDIELLAALPDSSDVYRQTYGIKSFIKGLTSGVELAREEVFTPTCTICGLTSGYQGPGTKTVQPAEARAKVDFRLVPDQRPEEVLEQLKTHLQKEGFGDVEAVLLGGEPPGRTDPDHPFLQMVAEAARPVYGQPQLIEPINGGSGPVHVFIDALGVPVATAGVGYPDSKVHAPNENIRVEDFVNGARHTARIVMEFARM